MPGQKATYTRVRKVEATSELASTSSLWCRGLRISRIGLRESAGTDMRDYS
jgi:hypothetical protein